MPRTISAGSRPGSWSGSRPGSWGDAYTDTLLDFNPSELTALPDDFTYSSTTGRTYWDSAGVLQTAASGTVRLNTYDPATLAHRGTQLEAVAATNRALHCRDFSDAVWAKTNTTGAKNQTGLDGAANSASAITATAGNGTILQSITHASTERISSAWVKRLVGTGTVEMTQDNGGTWTAVTVTAGWTRVDVPAATVANPIVGFRIVTDTDSIAVDVFQCEDSAAVTSEIITGAAAATRSAETLEISTLADIGWNENGMTFVWEGSGADFVDANQFILSDTTTRRFLAHFEGTVPQVYDGVNNTNLTAANLSLPTKIAVSLLTDSIRYSVNGAAVGTGTHNGNLLDSVTSMVLFENTHGFCSRLRLYKGNLSDAKLIELTT